MMKLRHADLSDLSLLRQWDMQPHVMEHAGDDGPWDWENELAEDPDWREMLIAEVDARPIGFLQIIDPAQEETHYWGDVAAGLRAIDIWIGDESDLNRGFGRQMMKLAIARCFAPAEVTAILIDPLVANTAAHRFYERLGFRCVERRQFGPDDCFVFRLERADWRHGSATAA